MNHIEFGKRMKEFRQFRRMTSAELAKQLGLNLSYVRQIECGRKTPSLEVFLDICNIIEVTPDMLLQSDLHRSETDELNALIELAAKLSPKECAQLRRIALALQEV